MFSSRKVLSYLAGLQSWVSSVLLILLFPYMPPSFCFLSFWKSSHKALLSSERQWALKNEKKKPRCTEPFTETPSQNHKPDRKCVLSWENKQKSAPSAHQAGGDVVTLSQDPQVAEMMSKGWAAPYYQVEFFCSSLDIFLHWHLFTT